MSWTRLYTAWHFGTPVDYYRNDDSSLFMAGSAEAPEFLIEALSLFTLDQKTMRHFHMARKR